MRTEDLLKDIRDRFDNTDTGANDTVVSSYDVSGGDKAFDAINVAGKLRVSFQVNASGLDNTTATLTAYGSNDGTNFEPLEDGQGNLAQVLLDNVNGGNYLHILSNPVRWIQLRYVANTVTAGTIAVIMHSKTQ